MTADPQNFPLTAEQMRKLDDLLSTLSRDEALYISGYLAGFARGQPAAKAAAAPPAPPLTILYGSETGHAAALARRMAERALRHGLAAEAVDMADFRPPLLKTLKAVALLTSTHGDGDPPDPAVPFFDFLLGRKAPRLDGVGFAVLGLGDSSYEHFCEAAKVLDRRLADLGGQRLIARVDCDVDYQAAAERWIDETLAAFAGGVPAAPREPAGLAALAAESAAPVLAPILDRLVLNGRGSDKTTLHVELSLAGSVLTYEPGDSLAVAAENDPALVAELLAALGLPGEAAVPGRAGDIPLARALAREYEITTLTPRFLEPYAAAAEAGHLQRLLRPENRGDLVAYCAGRQIVDVVAEAPLRGLDPRAFAAMLRPLAPRLYSLASSLAAYPEEAHLTVAVVAYESLGRARRGVASGFLERRGLDDGVPVAVESNTNFRLPADGDTPIIMIGAGTGVAPFRAFLQEREATGQTGRNWLFFGERRFRTDFLYQTEWQRLVRDGRLTRMDVAFSRDQADRVYVQHRLLARRREVFAWLAEGAHLYVCGDADRLAPGVHAALVELFEREGGAGRERAEEQVKQLQRERRYHRDVY